MNNEWISVKDRMPKKYDRVLMNFKGRISRIKGAKVTEGWYNGNYWDCYASLLNESIEVFYWQPLPEPPKPIT